MKLRTTILLNQNEKMVLNKIQTYAMTLNQVTPRIAGGWVRDKLLGIDSNDIDVTVDKISGYEFAAGMRSFYGWTGPVGKIKANPDKSKHLETAVMKINGISIDFLSLRKEEYGDSRIPKILSCTAEEDAFRRDLTINSLFYNLLTEKIEDFTNMGLSDLKNGIIRTPLQPEQTLKDDPLRLLRIIRFSIRFNFQIANEVLTAFNDEEIKNCLIKKISTERVRIEIFKMLDSDRFFNAFKIFCTYNLTKYVFRYDFDIDMADLSRIYQNYTLFSKNMNLDDVLVRLYVLIVFNSGNDQNNSYKNYIMIKNHLSCNKKVFLAIKQIERNLMLLKKISEKMSDEDAVFLLRHMKNDFKSSLVIYLMVGEYSRVEINDFFKNMNVESFNLLVNQNHERLVAEMGENERSEGKDTEKHTHSVQDISIADAVQRNKYLIFHLFNVAKNYESDLFCNKFPFDGKTITEWLDIEQNETSFYLEMAKVQFIVNKVPMEKMQEKLQEIQAARRIDGFKLFYLTERF